LENWPPHGYGGRLQSFLWGYAVDIIKLRADPLPPPIARTDKRRHPLPKKPSLCSAYNRLWPSMKPWQIMRKH